MTRTIIWFDWASNMYVNGRIVRRRLPDAEMYRIGKLLGWY